MRTFILFCLAALASMTLAADAPYTPKPGSATRQSICNGARSFVMKRYSNGTPLPQPLVFKIDRMKVSGDHCCFEAIPVFKDGSEIGTEYIMDIAFQLCLKKNQDAWEVIYDLSRTDVPSDEELKRIWQDFPKDFPQTLLPQYWRNLFKRVQ